MLATDLVEELRSQPFQQLKSRRGDVPPHTYSDEVACQPFYEFLEVSESMRALQCFEEGLTSRKEIEGLILEV